MVMATSFRSATVPSVKIRRKPKGFAMSVVSRRGARWETSSVSGSSSATKAVWSTAIEAFAR